MVMADPGHSWLCEVGARVRYLGDLEAGSRRLCSLLVLMSHLASPLSESYAYMLFSHHFPQNGTPGLVRVQYNLMVCIINKIIN